MWDFNEGALKFYESVGFVTSRRFMEFSNNNIDLNRKDSLF
ncbi:hypothetical protein ACV3P9_13510 [Clostridium perfringens]|nr:hypothetical protein [Clostridium perfringens]MDM0666456.1 hypothetical protein [Clostridium perfringens]MDM0675336.1 hypothetical protein [Clostridium perfringens]MDM0906764.1 hypothetical protein [Clostridium perfringens]MDM0950160.1 hypothetical protein [Clostridium perfringens]MDM0970212.1 hypothetical protein [Clostridium perfringens]